MARFRSTKSVLAPLSLSFVALLTVGAFGQTMDAQRSPSGLDLECEVDPLCAPEALVSEKLALVPVVAPQNQIEADGSAIAARDASMFERLTADLIETAISARLPNDGETTEPERRAAEAFYTARAFEPVFFSGAALNERGETILKVFQTASEFGLNDQDFEHVAFLEPGEEATDAQVAAQADIGMTLWALRYARHAQTGRINPASIAGDITLERNFVDPAAVMPQILAAENSAQALTGFHPQHAQFEALRAHLADLRRQSIEDHHQPIAEGGTIRLGDRDPRVPQLRERLGVAEPKPAPQDELSAAPGARLILASASEPTPAEQAALEVDPAVFDEALDEAVRAFQADHNLVTDGIVGPATFAALNEKAGDLVPHIVANMERWRWMPRDLGAFHVIANVPEYRLWVRRDDETVFTTRTVVGTNRNRTAIFSDRMEYIAVNPYWNVPRSITREELLPRILANPGYLASRNYEAIYNGRPVDPYAVNWQAVADGAPGPRIRQRPGRGNALGEIKFMFPNSHAIYFHDTPSRSLFGRDRRSFSHGCVRVQDPWAFAEALMTNEPGWDLARLRSLKGPRERNKILENQIPVHLTYFTARIDDDGDLIMARDIYGHHARVIAALGLET